MFPVLLSREESPHRSVSLPPNLPPGDHTMQCPRCQAENRAGRRFCAECGAPLALPCASCGFANEPEEKFCGGCGTPLTAAPHTPEPRMPPPQAYTPSHLTNKILAARPALAG